MSQPSATAKPYAVEAAEPPPDTAGRRSYPTDLTNAEWAILEPLLPKTLQGGRPEERSRRELVNAMFYVLKNGCTWRSLPHDFPPWSTVYSYFRKWRMSGLWQEINDALRPRVRQRAGKSPTPSAGIMDSQSARTTEKGGPVDTTEGSD
jgi:transposase